RGYSKRPQSERRSVCGHFSRTGSADRSPSARPYRPATAFDFPSRRLARGRAREGKCWRFYLPSDPLQAALRLAPLIIPMFEFIQSARGYSKRPHAARFAFAGGSTTGSCSAVRGIFRAVHLITQSVCTAVVNRQAGSMLEAVIAASRFAKA